MILLATLLSFGWPSVSLEWGPVRPLKEGEFIRRANVCCGSMHPYINGGETLYVSKWNGQESLLGKVVATPSNLHQVVAENDRAVKTSGTANRSSDGWMQKKDLLYVVRYGVRK